MNQELMTLDFWQEYIIYYRGKIVGGIYDDRLLVKPVKSAISLMPDANYEGAKEMLLVNDVDNKDFLTKLTIFYKGIMPNEVDFRFSSG